MPDIEAPQLLGPDAASARRSVAGRWAPVALRRAGMEQLIDEQLAASRESADLRRTLLVHPQAGSGTGLAPGIQVSVEALRPGEEARPPRRNSAALAIQLRGESQVVIDDVPRLIGPRDAYTVPPFAIQAHTVIGAEPSVRLVFSNAALLDLLGAHHVEPLAELGPDGVRVVREAAPLEGARSRDWSVRNDGRVQPLGADGWRLEYERLIDPPWVPFRASHWKWVDVVAELDRMATLDERYHGRRVCILHDPATERTNGTTSTLFASMCIRPAGIIDQPHRHSAAAVNYFMDGTGWSTVGGRRLEWGPGDLVFIAPAWEVHHHASGDQPVYQLAVQDNPLHLAMGSLVWQEDLAAPPRLLGAEPGFTTNRHLVEPPT